MTGFVGANTSGVYPAVSSTTINPEVGQVWGLGDKYEGFDGKKWVFVSASTSITTGMVVAIDTAGIAQAVTSALATAQARGGIAQNNISSGSYGWVQTFGPCSVAVTSTCSASATLYTCGTAGVADDTSTSQVKIAGLTIIANATTPATVAAVMGADVYFAL